MDMDATAAGVAESSTDDQSKEDGAARGIWMRTRRPVLIMDPAYFSAFAALAGSVIGGLTSLMTSWLVQRTQVKAQQSTQSIERKQTLYKDFLDESTRRYADALEHDKAEL